MMTSTTTTAYLLLLALGLGASEPDLPPAETVARFDPRAHLQPVDGAHCDGVLPAGVLEDSAWADLRVRYQRMDDPLGGTHRWIRATIADCRRGRAQLKWPLPDQSGDAFYRLAVTAASPEVTSLEAVIMRNGPPWSVLHQERIPLQADRARHVAEFALPASDHPIALILRLGTHGSVDLHHLDLQRHDARAMAAVIEARHPDGGPPNLLRNCHFPLGLPPGWNVPTRTVPGIHYELRAQDESPSSLGTIPLRISSLEQHPIVLSSPPFTLPMAHRPHVVSCVLRGTIHRGTLEIRSDGAVLVQRDIAGDYGPEGRRVVLAFQPAILAPFHSLRWEINGSAAIDQVMVAEGSAEAVPDFAPMAECELSLQGDPSVANTFTPEDPPHIRCALWRAPPDARIQAAVVDVSGRRQRLDPIDPTVGGWHLPAERFGSFRFEAQATDAAGRPLGAPQELVYHVVPQPRHAGAEARRSPFGVHVDPHPGLVAGVKRLGVNWVRLHGPNGYLAYWSGVEPEPGVFRFHDAALAVYRDAGLAVCGVLAQCPGWARITRPTGGAWLDLWWQPRDLAQWRTYVETTVAHYAGAIDHWEIWNEPWGGFWFKSWDAEASGAQRWHPGPDPLGDYLALSRVAAEAIRTANPQAMVIGVNGTRFDHGADWIRDYLERSDADEFDAVGFHSYHGDYFGPLLDPDSRWNRHMEERVYRPVREHLDASVPVWMSEGGATADHTDRGLLALTAPGQQADPALLQRNALRLPRYHLALFAGGCDKVFLYSLWSSGNWSRHGKDWSCLTTPDGGFNATAPAYAALTWHLEGLDFVERLNLDTGVSAFLFAGGDRAVAVVAGEDAHRPYRLPRDRSLRIRDLYANPLPPGADLRDLAYLEAEDPDHLRQALLPDGD